MKKTALIVAGLLLLSMEKANAVSDNALQRQIDNIKEDLQVMQRQMYRNNSDVKHRFRFHQRIIH